MDKVKEEEITLLWFLISLGAFVLTGIMYLILHAIESHSLCWTGNPDADLVANKIWMYITFIAFNSGKWIMYTTPIVGIIQLIIKGGDPERKILYVCSALALVVSAIIMVSGVSDSFRFSSINQRVDSSVDLRYYETQPEDFQPK